MNKELVILLKKKNRTAQELLYEKYSKKMFLIILRYINDADEAKSLINQSFYKIYISIINFSYSNNTSFEAWMKKIVVNESLLYLRKNKKLLLIEDGKEIEEVSSAWADKDLIAEDYFKLIRELPDGYRIIFNMYAIEGYSHQEIARELNIKESTSRSQLTHARAILKKKIVKYF